ncbi:hypothetical protein [Petrachloros mirabilis]
MQILLALAIVLLSFPSPTWAAESEVLSVPDSDNPEALRDAIRLLGDEIKLANRPQTYVIVDLAESVLLVKARGIELHRFAINRWSVLGSGGPTGPYRLLERPPIARRKIDPGQGAEQVPISLEDMPTEFVLRFSPPMRLVIRGSSDNFWEPFAFKGREWWTLIKGYAHTIMTGDTEADGLTINLVFTPNQAQSIAWAATEGMPFLLRLGSSDSSSR